MPGDPELEAPDGINGVRIPAVEHAVAHAGPEGTAPKRLAAATPLPFWDDTTEEIYQLTHVHKPGDLSQGAFEQGATGSSRSCHVDDRGSPRQPRGHAANIFLRRSFCGFPITLSG